MRTSAYAVSGICILAIMFAACAPVPAQSPSADATGRPSVSRTPIPIETHLPVPSSTPIPTATPRPTPTNPPTPSPAYITMLPIMSLEYMARIYPGFRGSSTWPMPTQRKDIVGWVHGDAIPPNPNFTISYTSGDPFVVLVTADDPPTSLQVEAGIDLSSGNIKPPFPPMVIEPFEIEPGSTSQFTLELPEGTYMIRVQGAWSNGGGIAYAWRIEVD